MLFKEKPDFVWGLIATMYTGNVIGVLMVLAFVPLFAAILRIPFAILTPLIVVVCAIGAYAVHNSMIDIWYMLIFGVIGYVFKKLDYPLAPLVLALVLGDLAENALRQSLIMSQGSLGIFFTRPISGVIMVVAVAFFLLPVVTPWWRGRRGAAAARGLRDDRSLSARRASRPSAKEGAWSWRPSSRPGSTRRSCGRSRR